MAPSIVEKYEQILTADPRSRIFVELARALVDRGDSARAIDVCRQGLEHHPSSILGRVVWGRALLDGGDARGAMDQFEIAIALDPASPYAYNLVGEALVAKGMHRDALPVLARAAELQPADERIRGWLEEARRRAKGDPQPSAAASEPPSFALEDEDDDRTEPYRPIAHAVASRDPNALERAGRVPLKVNGVDGAGSAARVAGETATATSTPTPTPTPTSTSTSTSTAGEDAGQPRTARPLQPDLGNAAAALSREFSPNTAVNSAEPRPPPLPRDSTPPPLRTTPAPRSVLYMIPGEATRDVIGPPAAARGARPAPSASDARQDAAEAERIAAKYAQEVREKLMGAQDHAPSLLRRHRRAVLAVSIALAVGAAAAVYLGVRAQHAAELALTAGGRARAGLARDTVGSLREAARLLAEARERAPDDPELLSLAAQVAAVLGAEHGDESAAALARELSGDAAAGDGALVARYLLARNAAERNEAGADVLAARPSSAPLVQALAGRILVEKRELEAGRGRLEIAARANPPLLRALSDLGDAARDGGDPEDALGLYAAALAAHPTHPRSVVGAAEARLALGKDLDLAARDLAAVDRDEASAPPRDLRLRFELAYARVLAANGDPAAAAARLASAASRLGDGATLASALAELHLATRAWDKAESAAMRAVQREPRDPAHRVLLARARIGRGRFAEALQATNGAEGRAIQLQRAIARYRLGQFAEARGELEKTARDGKLPAEAAVWYALTDVALGRAEKARPLLEKLAAGRSPPPLAHVALGRALEADGEPGAAEVAYRAATEREPRSPEGHLALGRLFLSRGRAADAVAPLAQAVKLDPADLDGRRLLGEARLLSGDGTAARAELDAVLLARPRDAGALVLLSTAWLAEKQPEEARRAADRAVKAAPRNAAALLAAARAALSAGDRVAARTYAERAVKAGAKGTDAAEAKRIAADARAGEKARASGARAAKRKR